jgi:hypothetical protein
MVKQRHAEERDREQDEINGYAEHRGPVRGTNRGRRDQRESARNNFVRDSQTFLPIERRRL